MQYHNGFVILIVFLLQFFGIASTNQNDQISKAVSEMYNDIPYPPVTEQDIKVEEGHYMRTNAPLRIVRPLMLENLNQRLFQGKEKFGSEFRALAAGGGTGTSTCYMAEQLRLTGGHVTYLDMSNASLNIAKQRAEIRSLDNIDWMLNRIEDIPELRLGQFDFVECSGVLHHMANPEEGLRLLADSLSDDGGMTIMVYARSGRTGTYHMQDMLKIVNDGVTDRQKEIENVRKLLKVFSDKTRALRFDRVGKSFPLRKSSPEVDAELYDRYCHKQDRPFWTSEFYEMVKAAGLHLVDRFGTDRLESDFLAIKDSKLRKLFNNLNAEKRAGAEELFFGVQNEHSYYLSKKENSGLKVSEEAGDLIPVVYDAEAGSLFDQIVSKSKDINPGHRKRVKLELKRGQQRHPLYLMASKYSGPICQLLGQNLSIRELYAQFQELYEDVSFKSFIDHFEEVYNAMAKAQVMYLKNPI